MSERKNTRLNLIAIALVAIAPVVGSYLLYLLWKPTSFVNYGELFGPLPLSSVKAPPEVTKLQGKWLFVMADSGRCDEYCARKLYIMRQVRLTQGQDQQRIERVWLVDDAAQPGAAVLDSYAGTHVVRAAGSELLERLAQGTPARDHIFIVDPLGNVIMRYPREPDPSRIKKDVSRLLRASRIG